MDNLERIQPPVFPVSQVNIPEAFSFRLTNGVPAYLIESGTGDILRMEFTFGAGQLKEHIPLISSATNMMLTEGSQKHSSEELHRKLDYYGAFLHMISEKDRAGLVVFFLNRHLEVVLELCHEILFLPAFPEKELDALMKKRLQWFLINREKVQNLANDQFFESAFGVNHPYGHKPSEEDFKSLNPSLLGEFHSRNYDPSDMAIIISGKIPQDTTMLLNSYFGNMIVREKENVNLSEVINGESEKKVFIEKPGAVQTAIRIGSRTINKRHPDYPGLKVLDSILGGYFGSRLMRNIREEKGYTYGIRSFVTSLDLSGYKMISTEVGSENCSDAINEIYKEINILRKETVSKDELAVVQNYMLGEMLRMFDGPFAVAESFKSVWEFGLSNEFYYRFVEKINTIDQDEIKLLANTYYNIDDLYEITSGPR